jgi:hypothetical protein
MGRSVAPKGFYTAAQAVKKTGIPKSTFNDMVKKGKITRIVPPNRSDGFYLKEEIDRLAKAHEAFILEYALDTSTFELAQEDDLEELAALYRELFGGNRESRERLIQEWYNANTEMFYVVKQDGLVVGYIAFMPLKQEAIEKIMAGLEETRFRTELLTPEYIAQFRPGEADSLFVLIGVKQGVKKTRLYGSRAITGGIEALEGLAKRGIVTRKLYATSRTQSGIRICKGMGFKQIVPAREEDNLLRFELDLETTTNPLFKDYQRFAKQAKRG